MGLTVKELIPIGEGILEKAGVENARADAETLLGFETNLDRQGLFLNRACEVDEARSEGFFGLVRRRAAGEPLQYITGEQCFMGHRIRVNPSVLIPRPETEILAEKAIGYLNGHESVEAALDLCTGSGAIAISIAAACPRQRIPRIVATDVSEEALATAKQNAAALGVSGRIDFLKSDLFDSIERGAFAGRFGLIVANPPYIRTGDLAGLQREIRGHEPAIALDGGPDGLAFYRRIAAGSRIYLRAGACLMAEIGHGQARDVAALFEAAGFRGIKAFQDLAGLDRIIQAKWLL